MATVILVRHGRTSANASGILAGRAAGVELDEVGREQAARTGERLAVVPLVGLVSSPLERCRQTSRFILDLQSSVREMSEMSGASGPAEPTPTATPLETIDDQLTECDYGEWQGRPLGELAKEKLWSVVQTQPSAAAFPGGESLASMQSRAVAAIRRHDAAVEAEHGPGAVWVAVSHGDVIKSILADALGMHLDLFQRINVGPASISIVRYGANRPDVIATNTDSGDLSWLRAKAEASRQGDAPENADAAVGGGAGAEASNPQPTPAVRS